MRSGLLRRRPSRRRRLGGRDPVAGLLGGGLHFSELLLEELQLLRGLALQLPEAAAELRPVGEAAVEVLV